MEEKMQHSAQKGENRRMFTLRLFEGAFNLIRESAIEMIFFPYFRAYFALFSVSIEVLRPGASDNPYLLSPNGHIKGECRNKEWQVVCGLAVPASSQVKKHIGLETVNSEM